MVEWGMDLIKAKLNHEKATREANAFSAKKLANEVDKSILNQIIYKQLLPVKTSSKRH